MAINTKVLEKNNVAWLDNDYIVLQAIQQKQTDDFSEKVIERLLQKELITHKRKITPKGTKFLREVSIIGLTEESKYLTEKLIVFYQEQGLKINNKKKTYEIISWFIAETGFEPKEIFNKVEEYVFGVKEKMYVSELGNLFWKAPNLYATKYNLNESKLYNIWKQL